MKLERVGNWLALILVLGAVGSAAFVYWRWEYRERRFDLLIEEIAPKYGVDKYLVKAVIRRESKFDPFVSGTHGEIGLMQVTDGAGRQWAKAVGRRDYDKNQLWKASVNIEAGTWYLARALNRWADKDPEDRIPFALAEYNAGYANVLRWLPDAQQTTPDKFIAAITYPSVRDYVTDVMENYRFYKMQGRL